MYITFESLSFVVGILSIILGILSIFLAIVFYFKSDKVMDKVRDLLSEVSLYSKNTNFVTNKITGKVIDALINKQTAVTEDGLRRLVKKLQEDIAYVNQELHNQNRPDLASSINDILGKFKESITEVPQDAAVSVASEYMKSALADEEFSYPSDSTRIANFIVGSTEYTVNDKKYLMDVSPYIKDDRTFVPVLYVAQSLGVKRTNILFDDASQTLTLLKGDRIIQFKVGSKALLINGIKIDMDVAPEINSGEIMIPFRFIAQALGAAVGWDESTQTVTFMI